MGRDVKGSVDSKPVALGASIFRHPVVQCAAGIIALALVAFVCFQLRLHFATVACLDLIVIVLMALQGSFLSSAVVSLVAVGLLNFYFVPPIFHLRVSDLIDYVELLAFLLTSAVITHLASRQRKSEALLREKADLLDLTHDGIFVRDMHDVITYWSRGAEQLYGWTAEKAVGKATTHQLLKTVFPGPLDEINAELLRAGRWEGELVHTRADGSTVAVASRWALESDPQGHPLSVLETNNDTTRAKQAAQVLHQQANLLEQSHDAIFVWEFPGRIISWYRGAELLYGFSRDEAIGRLSHELLQTQLPMTTAEFEAALGRGGQWTGELTHTTRDGRRIVVESRLVLMREESDRRLVLETNRDITERKRAEAELRQKESELRQLLDLTPQLVFVLAHERGRVVTGISVNQAALD